MNKPCTVAAGILENESGYSIELDSSQWQQWVTDAQSFRYCPMSADAPFTARREGQYWYAYRKQKGKLHKRYLGKGEELTLAKLEETASLLNTPAERRVVDTQKVTDDRVYVTREQFDDLCKKLEALQTEVSVMLGKSEAR